MKEDHRDMAEELFSHMSFSMTENGTVQPMYIMILPNNTTMPIVLQDKNIPIELYCEAAHGAAKQMNAVAMMLISERVLHDEESYLTLMYMTAIGECESIVSKIYSDGFGTKYTTDEREWIDVDSSSLLIPWKEGN